MAIITQFVRKQKDLGMNDIANCNSVPNDELVLTFCSIGLGYYGSVRWETDRNIICLYVCRKCFNQIQTIECGIV